ncbi:MAG: AMP-binding protein [Muribaculaceae bacterium]|nr:AMP-binding protein [Muribaculaceae bacterium]
MIASFNESLAKSIIKNWDHPALSDLTGDTYTYKEMARRIARVHLYFRSVGMKPGDKVALCGKNSAQWAVAFLATVTYGAVAVPILNEFKTENIHHLVNHSDSLIFFVDDSIWEHLSPEEMPVVKGFFKLSDFSLLMWRDEKLKETRDNMDAIFARAYPEGLRKEDIRYYADKTDELMLINYTSGSTGFSKGVMLTYGNLMSNAQFAIDEIPYLHPDDRMLSMLPMAHMYGLLVELLFPLMKGAYVSFLGRVPSPKILLDAFAEVKPKIIIAVPLVIEKIVTGKIFPVLKRPAMRLLTSIPGIRGLIYKKIRKQMIDAFGGNLRMVVIGGAALAGEVERFLRKIHFPYTVGYGMTECAPLIAYASPDVFKARSCGLTVTRMETRIDSPDPEHIPGELWVRGANVMQGYYKNPEATEAVFKDGWMNTGDMCVKDADGFIYIKGRSKTMILGPSGQNIYPEEIEGVLNHMPLVAESIVVDRDGTLVALVVADEDTIRRLKLRPDQVTAQMDENIVQLNKEMPSFARIKSIELQAEPFEKTPKHSIKRYLYK